MRDPVTIFVVVSSNSAFNHSLDVCKPFGLDALWHKTMPVQIKFRTIERERREREKQRDGER